MSLNFFYRKYVNGFLRHTSKFVVFRELFNFYARLQLEKADRNLRRKLKKKHSFSKSYARLVSEKEDPLFVYEHCKNLIWILNKLKMANFFDELNLKYASESSVYSCLKELCQGERLRSELKNIWSKNSLSYEDIELMRSYLNDYPNYALDNLKSWLELRPDFIVRKKRIFDFLNQKKGAVLDVGCSFNPFLDEYLQRDFFMGIDLSFVCLKIGTVLNPKNRGHLVCGDAAKLPIKNAAFDALVCSEVLEHVAFPEGLVKEIFRVLKSDGVCVISVPMHVVDVQCLPESERLRLMKYSDPTHRAYFYNEHELVNIFEKNNLHVLSIRKEPYYIFKLQKI